MGPGREVTQALDALGAEAAEPFADGLCGCVEVTCGLGVAEAAVHDGAHHLLSTSRGKTGIVVGVHSVRSGESLAFGDISVHSSDRMDNLLRVHS
jgi:hypothetical protein